MKTVHLLALAVTALLLSHSAAHAFSVEQGSTNSDGTAKFSDPDEQTPQGLVDPNSVSNGNSMGMTAPSVTMPNLPQAMGMDQGQSSFDHAYNHLQNQR